MTVSEIVKVMSGGRVTIPEPMRKAAKIEIGDYMIIKQFYGEITLTVAKVVPRRKKAILSSLRGTSVDGC